MSKLKNFLIVQACVTVLLTAVSFGVFRVIEPHIYPSAFLLIPIYFLIIEILFAGVFRHYYKFQKNKLHNFYLIYRGGKLLLSILVLVFYALSNGQNIPGFMITFLAYYMVLMVFESIFCVNVEKRKIKGESE